VRQVGRYMIQSRLGRGGMATVYKAHDPSIGRDVAVKFLHASLAEDEDCRARFLREARAAGGLSHPNIVVVHDVGEIEGRPYMAMELIDGMTLADLVERNKVVPVRDAVVIGLQLARALEYAHARGVVHRDIKPGNIMLLSDGRTVKVADFGIAHMDDGGLQRTQVGDVLGTPQYMSPEQTRGDKLDGRSDLFSAGIVLYQLLAGERPFRGENLVAVATQIATAEPPPLAQKRPDAPASLRRIVERCLAKLSKRTRVGRCAEEGVGRDRRNRAPSRQAAHHPAARQMGGDDGGHRCPGHGRHRDRDHAAPACGDDGSGVRLRRFAGALYRAAERGRSAGR
jgi:eukaryotic-like serine/threonine-protein kinase